MKLRTLKTLFVISVLGSSLAAFADPHCSMHKDEDRPGQSYKDFGLKGADPKPCIRACAADPKCLVYAFRFENNQAHCWLKGQPSPHGVKSPHHIAGVCRDHAG